MKIDYDLEMAKYTQVKEILLGSDYENEYLQASFRKIRHHLDQMIKLIRANKAREKGLRE